MMWTVLSAARVKDWEALASQPQMIMSVPLAVLALGSARHRRPPPLAVTPEVSGVTVLLGACSSGGSAGVPVGEMLKL